ncbi:MAG: hypothetical protein LBK47_07965 [Prevotellaceae bacterium]|jgi:cell division protein FtsB|nr:hypothetical protein [Prevotellaceae bacterium]
MKTLYLLTIMLLLTVLILAEYSKRGIPTPSHDVPPIATRDTVTIPLKTVDSVALQEASRRERRLSEQLTTTMKLLRSYVEEENQLHVTLSVLRDSVERLTLQQQQITAENHKNMSLATEVMELENQLLRDSLAVLASAIAAPTRVEVAIPANGKDAADTIALLEEKATWLATQPRRIYTIGAEDNVGEVEVANAYVSDNYLLIALSSPGDITAAPLNGALPVAAKHGVFVYPVPVTRKLLIVATVSGRKYEIKTSLKQLKL